MSFKLPYIDLPRELTGLLKATIPNTGFTQVIFKYIPHHSGMSLVLDRVFSEFNDGRGLEKTINALGWENFRDRYAGIYIYKFLYGVYPKKSDIELVDDIKFFESRFRGHGISNVSRIFLLGFYLKMLNLRFEKNNDHQILHFPKDLESYLKRSNGRVEKIDVLILLNWHFVTYLGEDYYDRLLNEEASFEKLFDLLAADEKEDMIGNLLSYGSSIDEEELFFYTKV